MYGRKLAKFLVRVRVRVRVTFSFVSTGTDSVPVPALRGMVLRQTFLKIEIIKICFVVKK